MLVVQLHIRYNTIVTPRLSVLNISRSKTDLLGRAMYENPNKIPRSFPLRRRRLSVANNLDERYMAKQTNY